MPAPMVPRPTTPIVLNSRAMRHMVACTYAPVGVGPLTSPCPLHPQVAEQCLASERESRESPAMRHEALLRDQAGVISRAQALASGLSENDVRRLLRRRSWVCVHPGVYVNHTGELTWLQRAWAAVLFAWPAALCDESALR